MKVLIITEGSRSIGFGHITRCTSLYQAFEEQGILPVFIINGDDTVKDLLRNKNYEIFNWLDEKKKIFSFMKTADIAIIDSYLADYELYEKVSKLVKVPVYVDDNKRIDYPKGIVANGTIYAEELNYPEKKGIIYLLGSQYITIRKEFWNMPDKEIKENIKAVMITFGGDDAKNMTPKVLRLLNEKFPELIKKVIIGKGFKNIEQIEILKDTKTKLIYYPDAEGMKKIILESDIAISAAGQTLYELARVGVPTIAIAVADNQMNNVKGLQKAGFIEYAGWWEEKEFLKNIIQKMNHLKEATLREKKGKVGKGLVDGLGATRIAKQCIKKYFSNSIILRKADINDMFYIYELSNDLEVRKNSFNPDRIDIETHKTWFYNKLRDLNCIFLVSEINNQFIGQVRFDINGGEAIISVSIIGAYRHLGVGQVMTQKALHYLKVNYPDIRCLKALVKEENIISRMFFESLNFLFIEKKVIKNQNAVEYGIML